MMQSFGTSAAGGRRSAPRVQAPLIAVLSTAAGDHPAAVTDISRTGARLCAEMLPSVGEALVFRTDDVQVEGRIIWSTGHKCGVEFGAPIAAAEVDQLRRLASLKPQYDCE